jgi:hypothetical protein
MTSSSSLPSVAGLAPPDTRAVRAALEHARDVSPPYLFGHVMRSYFFAELLVRQSRARVDRELLCTACVLHDLGMVDTAPGEQRFELEGADAARRFLAGHGVDARGQDVVWDAIALHTTPEIPQRKGGEIALCQGGIAIDVGVVPPPAGETDAVRAILAAYPRAGFTDGLVGALVGLHAKHPRAAASAAVADACDRHVPGFRRPNVCDALAAAFTPDHR